MNGQLGERTYLEEGGRGGGGVVSGLLSIAIINNHFQNHSEKATWRGKNYRAMWEKKGSILVYRL